MSKYYKLTQLDGCDFHTGETINYRKNLGKIVHVPKKSKTNILCSNDVLHASENIFDALYYAQIPCSIFIVEGIPVVEDDDKAGFKKLKIVKEIQVSNWHKSICKFMIHLMEKVKPFTNGGKTLQVLNQVIKVYQDAYETGKFDIEAAEAARATASAAVRAATEAAVATAEIVYSATRAAYWVAEATRAVYWAVVSVAELQGIPKEQFKAELQSKFLEILESEK